MKEKKTKAKIDPKDVDIEQEVQNETKEDVVIEDKIDLGINREELTDAEYIAKLEELAGNQVKQANECKQIAQRLQADFDNYRKRNNSMAEDMKHFGESLVIEKMLVVLDNCELARKYLQDQAALQGFNMMETQILSALDGFGLKEVETNGKDFDAKYMTCIERSKVQDENQDGKVLEATQKGYTLNGKLLRAASVKVGYIEKKSED